MHRPFRMTTLSIAVVALLVMCAVPALSAYEFEYGPKYDLGGGTVVIVKDREGSLPEEGTEFYDRWKAVEEFFNCKIEMIWTGQHNYQDVIARIMAGDPVDIVRLEGAPMQNLIVQGLLMPLNEVWGPAQVEELDVPDFVKYEYMVGSAAGTYRGKIYATQAFDRQDGPYGRGLTFLWNKSMFEREGLPSLYDIVEAGEWTWDKMFEICQQLTKDTDGDGVIDQYGTGNRLTLRNGYYLIAANGGALTREVDTQVVAALDEPEAVETAEFIRKLVEAGVTTVSKEGAEGDNIEFQKGNIGLCFQFGAEYWRGMQWWLTPELMADDWGIAPFPKGPSASDGPIAMPLQDIFHVGVPISSRYNPDAVLALFAALYPRNPDLYDEYLTMYEGLVRSEEDWEAVKKYWLDVEGDPHVIGTTLRHWMRLPGFQWTQAVTGQLDYTTHVSEIMPSLQAQLDDMFNKSY